MTEDSRSSIQDSRLEACCLNSHEIPGSCPTRAEIKELPHEPPYETLFSCWERQSPQIFSTTHGWLCCCRNDGYIPTNDVVLCFEMLFEAVVQMSTLHQY
ncbi:hypothetical protein NPIL_177321 [Nephila pilipes]|uniref:Uncharacterized protein n=1 Tax=Nephila pilipes TaxID=299642 RepID=A0A8X6TYZ6_NEPPI|nr:hypothetical protein NPIL_177321 [Nephila pilipes]